VRKDAQAHKIKPGEKPPPGKFVDKNGRVLPPEKRDYFTTDQVIEAIRKCRGMLSPAAQLLGCGRDTVWGYVKRYPEVAACVQESREAMKDAAELSLAKKVIDGESWAVCFFLKCQAKERGYVERVEHTGANGDPMRMVVDAGESVLSRLLPELAIRGEADPLGEPPTGGEGEAPLPLEVLGEAETT
jgi:hypothetical protein